MALFNWLILAVVGAFIGIIAAFIMQTIRIPQALCVAIGIIGALAGGALYQVTGITLFGGWTFYLVGILVALGFLAGASLVFTLTSEDKRV